MQIDLSGMTIGLTGASRGIGFAIARHLGQAGAGLALHCNRNREPLEKLMGQLDSPSAIFQANLEDVGAGVRLFADIEKKFGRIDVWINNAGVALKSPVDLAAENWISDWDETMKVNLRATALLCKLAVNHFLQHGGGRIINIASRAAFRGDTIDYLAYAASKGGIVSLTRSIARGFGKQDIKAFIIAPGFVRTDMAQEFIDFYGEEKTISDLALNRLTEPDDVAPLVAFLASGLGDHATGGTFDINAGSYVH
jgi:3-oxoacyl-[acyl-carrier protein] reductase